MPEIIDEVYVFMQLPYEYESPGCTHMYDWKKNRFFSDTEGEKRNPNPNM
jgi:hypothetical protein